MKLVEVERSRTVAQQIHAQLRSAIISLELRPGAPISEKEIAQAGGISRTPVREALIRLADEGLVTIQPQVGTFVAKLSIAAIGEALFIREAIECTALAKAGASIGPNDIERLQRNLEQQDGAMASGGRLTELFALDGVFHRMLLEMTGHGGVWPIVAEARDRMTRLRNLIVPDPSRPLLAISQHRAIVAALAAGDTDRARTAMAEHIHANAETMGALRDRHSDLFRP